MPLIGLVAGNGSLPVLFAEQVKTLGYSVFAIAHEQETDPELTQHVEDALWIPVGQIQNIIPYFKTKNVTQAVLAGGIHKTHLFDTPFDQRAQSLLSPFKEKRDDAILRGFASTLEQEGIAVMSFTHFIPSLMAEEGEMTRPLTERERDDIAWGWPLAKQIGALDIGQTIVVRDGVLLAVEAIEGTDAAILRGGTLGRESAVVIKCLKPHQDVRFDLPTVGLQTIQTMIKVKASVLAIEAKATLILEKEAFLAQAKNAGIAVVRCLPRGGASGPLPSVAEGG
jgi:hypothetical protein